MNRWVILVVLLASCGAQPAFAETAVFVVDDALRCFTWEAAENADYYDLELAMTPAFETHDAEEAPFSVSERSSFALWCTAADLGTAQRVRVRGVHIDASGEAISGEASEWSLPLARIQNPDRDGDGWIGGPDYLSSPPGEIESYLGLVATWGGCTRAGVVRFAPDC